MKHRTQPQQSGAGAFRARSRAVKQPQNFDHLRVSIARSAKQNEVTALSALVCYV